MQVEIRPLPLHGRELHVDSKFHESRGYFRSKRGTLHPPSLVVFIVEVVKVISHYPFLFLFSLLLDANAILSYT